MTQLEVFREHCRRMAKSPDQFPREVELWNQLADEIDTYLAGGLVDELAQRRASDDEPLEGM